MFKCCHCSNDLTDHNSSAAQQARGKGRGLCTTCSKAYAKKRRTLNPKLFIMCRVRGSAKLRGIECSITERDLPEIPEYCPVLPWIKLVYAVGKGVSDGSVALDRIDSSVGYVKGNIRFISHRANTLKSDATDQELIMLGKDAATRKQ